MIEAEHLTKRYGPFTAVEDLSFTVAAGEILGFLGPNGAGKSTTLRVLSGYHPPSSGRARIDGLDLQDQSLRARQRLGYLPENFVAPPELRVGEYLRFRARLKGLPGKQARTQVKQVAETLSLSDRLKQPFAALSKGYRQRVGLADALLGDPPALLLDEPFGGLDPLQRQEFREFLRGLAEQGKAILFSSHVLPEVEEIADRVLILHHGVARAQGNWAQLAARLAAQTPVQFRTEGDATAVESALRAWLSKEELDSLQCVGNEFRFQPDHADRRQELFEWLAAEHVQVSSFQTLVPNLEDLFRSMTALPEAEQAR